MYVMHMALNFGDPVSLQRGNRRIVIGVAVSIAVHALFLLAYRNTTFKTMEIGPAEPTVLSVMIVPPAPPPPPPEPEIARPAAPAPSAPSVPTAARATRPAPPQAVIAVPESASAAPDPFVVQQEETVDPAPKFDMNAARETARANAHLRDPSKEGTALAQFPEPALQTESKLARGIRQAKRPDCKDGLPGGLLAPIYLLMEKKDSGCKW
ncbi:hypothetical protein NM04_04885 [Massilia aurea]|uniref:Uncharacterized protein n=2 Tax=Massilia aurea TaxID=373040 RepID=A0A422QPF0_9BURK|nr:hypothetical protein NM04_04885 [Massilia aurea]